MYDHILNEDDPGLSVALTYDVAEDIAAPFIAAGARPQIAILREQNVNNLFPHSSQCQWPWAGRP